MARAPTNGDRTPVPRVEEGPVGDGESQQHNRNPGPLWKRVSALWSALVILGAVAAGGGSLYVFAKGSAPKSEVRAVERRIDNHEARVQMLENAVIDDKHDRRIMQLQLFELARTTGARVVPGLPSPPDEPIGP